MDLDDMLNFECHYNKCEPSLFLYFLNATLINSRRLQSGSPCSISHVNNIAPSGDHLSNYLVLQVAVTALPHTIRASKGLLRVMWLV